MFTIPDPATLITIGSVIGTAAGSAFIVALRAGWRTKAIQTEILGPGQEPSLREMIRAGSEASLGQYKNLHTDIVHLADRLKMVEDGQGKTVIATTLSAMNTNILELMRHSRRLRVNIHHIANVTQVKLYSEEEVEVMAQEEQLKGNLGI